MPWERTEEPDRIRTILISEPYNRIVLDSGNQKKSGCCKNRRLRRSRPERTEVAWLCSSLIFLIIKYYMVIPPSMEIILPVINPALALAAKRIASAISSGVPRRPIG